MDRYLAEVLQYTLVGGTILGAIALIVRRRPPNADSRVMHEMSDRLHRMEQALDSVAIEVERLSEGQRFAVKLLAERPANGAETRVVREITPH